MMERDVLRDRRIDLAQTIPIRMARATFNCAELKNRVSHNPNLIKQAEMAALCIVHKQVDNVVLMGKSGSGKTSLACAILWELCRYPVGKTGRFQSSVELACSHSAFGAEPDEVFQSKLASVLVLDDLGSESQAKLTSVHQVIQYRHHTMAPTIFTTWLDESELEARFGNGIARRILERSRRIITS